MGIPNRLVVIGAPSSAGAYAPGQEKTPDFLRSIGFLDMLSIRGILVEDVGNTPGFRWTVDKGNQHAMNADKVAIVAGALSGIVHAALDANSAVLVLGGDCTVELGTVAGALQVSSNIGLVYIDLDTDLNTPKSTKDGALDWMGVAHMLDIEGTDPELAALGPRMPMLGPEQIFLYAAGNSKKFEQQIINSLGISEFRLDQVVSDPKGTAQFVVDQWAQKFDYLLIHLDVDVLDYLDFPLAENYRRNVGLKFVQLLEALEVFVTSPNWSALTVTEVNPDHGEENGKTLQEFGVALADVLASSPQLKSH